MFKSRTFPESPEKLQFRPLPDEEGEEEGEEGFGEGEEELFIDLEKLLEYHTSVRIRLPARANSTEGSSEDGTREIVVSKSEQEGGVVF
jgi:hypothetical protein